ncbi:MAG: fimbrillin family protein [Candidatus Cryptobacteroides sp.]
MKKTIFIFTALALLSASCTKTELVSNNAQSIKGGGIGFSAYTAKPTKAAEVTTANLTSFNASAIGNGAIYFDDVTFTKSTVWESDPVYFWPAYALDFYAYNVPGAENGTFSSDIATDAQTLGFKPAADFAKQLDLVAAYAASKTQADATSTESSLALTFKHYLTQIVVKAKSSNSNYVVKVSEVKVANLKDSLTYTFSSNSSAVATGAADADYTTAITEKTLSAAADSLTTGYLVPQTVTSWTQSTDLNNTSGGTYLALKVSIATAGGAKIYPKSSESAWMAVPVPAELAFAQGKKYTVTLDFFGNGGAGYVDPENPGELDGDEGTNDNGKPILGGAIKFDATVSAWDTVEVLISL